MNAPVCRKLPYAFIPVLIIITVLLGYANSSTRLSSERATKQNGAKIWAAISVNEPVFIAGWTKNLQINFILVNDSGAAINPEIEASEIVVNGETWADSNFIFSNGPRDNRFTSLPPKDYLLVGYALGERFTEPDIYRVSWRGRNFEAPEIVFRVLPKKQR
jgi:hypothetical protein